jgi:CMP-N-acetylneuraminic acid synthetase
MNKSVALILAKSKSNRLPQKNTRDFKGQMMFLVNVKKCLRIFNKVYVSSDSDWILDEATKVGAIGIKRGEELCGDTPNIPVYQHALQFMGDIDNIIAVQANSPTVEANIIILIKSLMERGIDEVMTCDLDYNIYGSVWAVNVEKLKVYGDPYKPFPKVLIVDKSIDIHTDVDYRRALSQ